MDTVPVLEGSLSHCHQAGVNSAILLEEAGQCCGHHDFGGTAVAIVAFERDSKALLGDRRAKYTLGAGLGEDASGAICISLVQARSVPAT